MPVLGKLFQRLRTFLPARPPAGRRPRCRPALEALERRLAPAVLTVDSPADNTAPDDVLTLREAVALVDGTLGRSLTLAEQAQVGGRLGSGDTIQFSLPPGPQTITLTGGELDLTRPVAINGPGAANLTIDGNHLGRVFTVGHIWSVTPGLVVSLSGLTVANGSAPAADDYGGGLLNFGTLTLTNVALTGNAAGGHGGGGIYNVGRLTVSGCTLTGNVGAGSGGGLYNNSSGRLTVSNTTFAGNSAGVGGGGGIYNEGRLTVSGCTFSNNISAADGAGITNAGPLRVRNTTFAGNSAGSDGGGIWNGAALRVSGCTLAGNSAASAGGGLYNSGHGTLTLVGSTLWGNAAGTTGGGLQNWLSATLTHVTITANRAGAFGGGIYNLSRKLKLRRTTVAGNFRGAAPGTAVSNLDGSALASGRSHHRRHRAGK
jgi:hypothetical protein